MEREQEVEISHNYTMPLVSGYSSSSGDEDQPSVVLKSTEKVTINPKIPTQSNSVSAQLSSTAPTSTEQGPESHPNAIIRNSGVIIKESLDDSLFFERYMRKGHQLENQSHQTEPRRKRRKGKDFLKKEDTAGEDDLEIDVDAYLGPWAKFIQDHSDNDKVKEIVQIQSSVESEPVEEVSSSEDEDEDDSHETKESTKLYISSTHDYQNRSYLHPPTNTSTSTNLLNDSTPDICFPPSSISHTYAGHTNGVNRLELFPKSQHLLLSCGNDNNIYLWNVYDKRELVRGYFGHNGAVKDVNFNANGTKFISVGFDKYVKVWDTLTGECLFMLKLKHRANVVRFIPGNDEQFIVGLHSSKIEHYETNKGQLLQRYDSHLGSINSLEFFDVSSTHVKFISCSEDKTMKIWQLNLNIPIKQISDPKLHAMTNLKLHPSGKYIVAQSMDNTLVSIHTSGKYKFNKAKTFSGHHTAGFNVNLDFSPNGQFILSGDSKGEVYLWDWQNKTLKKRLGNMGSGKGGKKCIGQVVWNKKEVSSLVCAGVDGKIYYWE